MRKPWNDERCLKSSSRKGWESTLFIKALITTYDFSNWSLYFSLENKVIEQSIFALVIILSILITFSFDDADDDDDDDDDVKSSLNRGFSGIL